jgi:transposase
MITELTTGAVSPDNLSPEDLRTAVREFLEDRGQRDSVLKTSEDRNLLLLAWGMGLQVRLDISEIERIKLKLQIEGLKQGQGKHRSEKMTDEKREQCGLPPKSPQASDLVKKKRRKKKGERKKGGGRGPQPKHLHVITQVLDVPPEEREGLEYLGTKVWDELACEPRRFYTLRYEQRMYGPKGCTTPTVIAPLPPQVIPKAAVSVSFIVHVIISKYADHIPLYRQAQID